MTEKLSENISQKAEEKQIIASYWHKRAEDFAHLRARELRSEKNICWQKELAARLPQNGLKILDVGCGAGFFSILLAKLGHKVTGVDLTPAMILQAQSLAAAENAAAEFIVMDAEQLDFPDNTFDAVIARNLMWNLPQPAKAYAEWLRVLKPGGILLNYDAEYAKELPFSKQQRNAHAGIAPSLLNDCRNIYKMLAISSYERPRWDKEILSQLGVTQIIIDGDVGRRIYKQRDDFYIAAPMFLIQARKA